MPQIPLYERSVQPSTEVGGVEVSPQAAAAPWRAAAQLGGQMAQIGFRKVEVDKRLEAEKRNAESKLLRLDVENRIGIAKNAYESGLQNRLDYRDFGTEGDKEYSELGAVVSELLADPRLQDYPELTAELKIHSEGELENARIDAREIGVKELNAQGKSVYDSSIEALIETGNNESISEAIGLIDDSPFHTDIEKEKKRIAIPMRIQEANIRQNIDINAKATLDAIVAQKRGGEKTWPDLSPEQLTAYENSARASYNRQNSDNATAMWDRFNAVRDGKTDEDTFRRLSEDLDVLDDVDKISPQDYNSLRKAVDNPYGTVKTSMPSDRLNNLWTQIGEYDPETDPQFTKASKLWATINAVPSEQDRTLLKGLMKDAQDGVPQSPYWDEMQELINADSRRDFFGKSEITPETGVFAKREVARYLREKPTDREGAMKIYDAISADDKKLSTRSFYREQYGYGASQKKEADVRVWGAK